MQAKAPSTNHQSPSWRGALKIRGGGREMGRAPCCDKANVKKGPWSPEEDSKLKGYIEKYGTGGNWIALPQKAGLKRCGKSCRLRWLNYLRPNIKHGEFSDYEDRIICSVFANIGSKWSVIANYLPGRTDNDIKNYWNTKLKKKLMGMVPVSQRKPHQATFSHLLQAYSLSSSPSRAVTTAAPLSSSYECSSSSNPYYTPAPPTPTSFTRLEPISSIPSSLLNINTRSTPAAVIHPQEGFVSPMHHYQVKDSLFIEASSSSSDGSGGNQISHGKEPEYDQYGTVDGRCEQMGFQNYAYNGLDDQNQKFMISNGSGSGGGGDGWTDQKPNGMWGETPLDFGLEEFKQLISTNLCNNFSFDENKTEERVMYY